MSETSRAGPDRSGQVTTVGLRDLEVAYRGQGEGPSVVLIHGLAQDHRMWSKQQDGLGAFSTFAYDVRGHGRTTVGAADGTLRQLGEDLIAFLEHVGPATCAGHSLGGTVALWAAAERPDLVQSVVASATSSVVGSAATAFYHERIELFESGSDDAIRQALLEDTQAQLHSSDLDAEQLTDYRLETIADRRGYINGARAMAGLHDHPLNDRLEQIECSVLVLTGEHDPFCPWRAAEIMLEHLPNSEYRQLDGIGHLVTDENPAGVTAVIKDWLQRRPDNER